MNCIARLVRGRETVASMSDPCSDDNDNVDDNHSDDDDDYDHSDDNDDDDACVIVRPTVCIASTG